MAQTYEFYDARAKEAAAEAKAATLDNVRERVLRSAAAWQDMADRARTIEKERTKAAEARAERQMPIEAPLSASHD